MVDQLAWASGFPKNDDPDATCVSWKSGKILNTRCNEKVDASTDYYSGTTDLGVITFSPSYTSNDFHRGYLCETRPIHTSIGNILCIFPFRYIFLTIYCLCILYAVYIFIFISTNFNPFLFFVHRHHNKTYASCSHDLNPENSNTGGQTFPPWCATEVGVI